MDSHREDKTGAARDRQIQALRTSTAMRKQDTIRRLQESINRLQTANPPIPITAQAVFKDCGLQFGVIRRNKDAYDIFKSYSAGLAKKERREREEKRKRRARHPRDMPPPLETSRDPLLMCDKEELVTRLRAATERITRIEPAYQGLVQERISLDIHIAKLEARLQRYESHPGSLRADLQREEHGG